MRALRWGHMTPYEAIMTSYVHIMHPLSTSYALHMHTSCTPCYAHPYHHLISGAQQHLHVLLHVVVWCITCIQP
jgi:hypothetical protein